MGDFIHRKLGIQRKQKLKGVSLARYPDWGNTKTIKLAYLPSYFIIMKIKSRSSIISVFQSIDEAPCLLFAISDVITAPSPLPIICNPSLFLDYGARASGDLSLSALKRDFVSNGGRADGVDKRGLPSGYKNIITVRIRKEIISIKRAKP